MNTTKKYIAFLLALTMMLALAGCGASEAVQMKDMKSTATEETDMLPEAAEGDEAVEDPVVEEPSMEEVADPDTETVAKADSSSQPGHKPTEPGKKPTQPTKPTDSGHKPTEPVKKPTQPAEPTQPTKPTEPTQPTKPTEPTKPTQPTKPTEPGKKPDTHEHNWQPVYGTVHHEEKGHYENVEVKPAWDEPQYEYWNVCSACGGKFGSATEVGDHIHDVHGGAGSYSVKQFVSGYIHHDAVYEKQWVVDQAAWDEQVITGYECFFCGKKKSA